MAAPRPLRTLVALSVLAIACSPLPARHVPAHRLADVLAQNLTCPVAVAIDEETDRVPRLIKTISCDHTAPSDRLRDCVNLYDSVLVFNRTSGTSFVLDVSVGCVHWTKVGLPTKHLAETLQQD